MEEKKEEENKIEDLKKEDEGRENSKEENDIKALEKEKQEAEEKEKNYEKLKKEEKKKEKKKENHKNNLNKIKKINSVSKNFTDKIRKNPWIVSTIVLGILVLVYLIGNFSSAGNSISEKRAGEIVLDFVNSQVDGNASIINITKNSGLYNVIISLNGKEIPVYLTEDGQNLVQGVVPLSVLQEVKKPKEPKTPQTEVPKLDKPVVELFIMAMCPYGTQAEKGIISALETLGDKIDFKLRFVSYAMHGKNEVDENTRLYCVQKEAPEKLYDYMKCYLNKSDPVKWDTCISEVGISKSKVDTCISSTDSEFKITELFNDKSTWKNGKYPQYNVDKDLNTKYGVQGSPTLVVNGVVSTAGRDSASYLDGICKTFNTAPEECGTTLSSASPKPGFGWEAGSESSGSAQCA